MRRFLLALFLLLASAASAQQVFQVGAPQISGLSPLPSADIWVGNGSGIATAVAPSGDLTVSNTGAFTIGANKVTLPDIAQIATNTVLGNATSGTANVLTQAMPSCSGASSALIWTTNTGFGCNSIASGGTVNAGTAGQISYYAASTNAVSGNPNATISSGALTLGQSGTAGSVVLNGATSGTVTLKVPAVAGSNIVTFPAGTTDFSSTGGASQVVKQTSSGGALTVATLACTDLSNGASGCSTATGTSGATLPLLNAANTWSGVQTYNNSTIKMVGSSSGATTITSNNAGASNFTLTIPAISGTAITSNDTNTVALGVIAQSGANTMLGNWSGSTANVAANAMPSCADTGTNHLNYVSGTGITCGTSSSGGALTLISTQTASSSASLAWTGLSTTKKYLLVFESLVAATSSSTPYIQLGSGAGPTWSTSTYFWGGMVSQSSAGTTGFTGSGTDSGINIAATPSNAGLGGTINGFAQILGAANSAKKHVVGAASIDDGSSWDFASTFSGTETTFTAALTAIRIIMSAGNITSGTASLYSYSN